LESKDSIIFDQLPLGPMGNFTYIIGDPVTQQAGIVDPGWGASAIMDYCRAQNYIIAALLLTHGHYDHANAVPELLKQHPVPVYLSKHEADFYRPECAGIRFVDHQDEIHIGGLKILCLHTPGHTPGSQCFLTAGRLLTGDTLFFEGCGRCDLPGGNARRMYDSLYNVILKLPESTLIYPGHDYGDASSATLGEQKQTNPYLRCRSPEEFLTDCLGINP